MPTYQIKYEPEHRKWMVIDQATGMMVGGERKIITVKPPCELMTIGDKGWLVVTGNYDPTTATVDA